MVPLVALLEASAVMLLIVTFTTDVALWPAAIVLAVAAMFVLLFRRVAVTVDHNDLVLRYASPVGFTHRIHRRDIDTAEVVDVRPMKWGGWGYRGSRLLFGRAAVVIRGGPGLQVVTKKGKALTVTVDEPEGAVAALGFQRPGATAEGARHAPWPATRAHRSSGSWGSLKGRRSRCSTSPTGSDRFSSTCPTR